MKTLLEKAKKGIHIPTLIIGIVIGFALGAQVINSLAPTSDEMLRLCKMDPQSIREDRAFRSAR